MSTQNIKSGMAREDGKVFWRYHPNCKNGEQWVTPVQYRKWRDNARKREHKRYRERIKASPEARLRRAEAMRRYRTRLRLSGRTPQPRALNTNQSNESWFDDVMLLGLLAGEAIKLGIPVSDLPDSYSREYFNSLLP